MTFFPKQHELIGFIINTDCVFYAIGTEVVNKNYIYSYVLKNKKFQYSLPEIETQFLGHRARSLVTIAPDTSRAKPLILVPNVKVVVRVQPVQTHSCLLQRHPHTPSGDDDNENNNNNNNNCIGIFLK